MSVDTQDNKQIGGLCYWLCSVTAFSGFYTWIEMVWIKSVALYDTKTLLNLFRLPLIAIDVGTSWSNIFNVSTAVREMGQIPLYTGVNLM